MEQSEVGLCIDRVLPLELKAEAERIALAENPSNAPPKDADGQPRMGVATAKLWKPGRRLKVRFLDGTPAVQEKVVGVAKEWEKHANIHFDFGDDTDAEIRVSFGFDRGSWSALGTDALVERYFPRHQPTVNFGWLNEATGDDEYSRVVLHEFGHVLGCIHEHSLPAGGIRWDEEAVIRFYSGKPNYWSVAKIRRNVIEKYSASLIKATPFDPDSIMLYAFPPELTLDRRGTHSNSKLSPQDIQFIGEQYPR